jgi:hypothetical protein
MSIFSRWLFIFPIKDAFTNGKILTAGMEYFLDLNKIMIFPSTIIQVEHVLDFMCLCLIEFILEGLEDLLTGEVLFFVEVVEHYQHVLDDVLSEERRGHCRSTPLGKPCPARRRDADKPRPAARAIRKSPAAPRTLLVQWILCPTSLRLNAASTNLMRRWPSLPFMQTPGAPPR